MLSIIILSLIYPIHCFDNSNTKIQVAIFVLILILYICLQYLIHCFDYFNSKIPFGCNFGYLNILYICSLKVVSNLTGTGAKE